MGPAQHLVAACATLVVLGFLVGLRMVSVRVSEMRQQRFGPQAIALSRQRAQRFEDTRAADNFTNLFEVPVVFYALCALAIATGHVPGWLPALAWLFVASRIVHSAIHCTCNNVIHRLAAFVTGFLLVVGMWVAFALSYIAG